VIPSKNLENKGYLKEALSDYNKVWISDRQGKIIKRIKVITTLSLYFWL
jgi:hypothetical protein